VAQDKRYWDSSVFLRYLNKEPNYEKCLGVLDAAAKGNIIIITSAFTFAEVVYLKSNPNIDNSDMFYRFMESSFIQVINLDRYIAEYARDLMIQYPKLKTCKAPDAIHVASAIKKGITIMDTFDDDVIKLDGKIGNPILRIGNPDIPFESALF
jgi:predicted nucleic acid-binding protein